MRTRLPWLSLVIVFVWFLVTTHSSENDFTCVAGNFTAGQRGNVTCHFGPDIHKPGYHFEIVRYPNNAPASHSGEDVLRCHRLGNERRCVTGKGFEFNEEKIEANLTIFIPHVSRDQEGRYACQLIPPDSRKKRLCELNVREVLTLRNNERKDSISARVVVLAVIVGLLLLLCGAFIVLLLRRTNKRKLKEFFCPKQKRNKTANTHNNARYHLVTQGKEVFPGDDEDTKENGERPYKIDIDLKHEVYDKLRFEDSEGYKRKYNDDAEERETPYKVDIALDHEVFGKSSTDEREGYKKKYSNDPQDKAKERCYKVKISLDYEVEGKDETDEGYKPRRYDGDSEDEKREALKFTIPPPHHSKEDEKEQPAPQVPTLPRHVPRLPAQIKQWMQ